MENSGRLKKLYLVSLSSTEGSVLRINPASMRITFKVLCRSVDDLVDIELFPMMDMEKPAFIRSFESLAGEGDADSVFGISVMSNDYPLLREVASLIRRQAPAAPIVAGGPHFIDAYKFKKSVIAKDSTAARALGEGLVDVVCIGEGSPLRDLILEINAGAIRFIPHQPGFSLQCVRSSPPDGLRYRSPDGRITGKGKGCERRPKSRACGGGKCQHPPHNM